MQTLQTATWKQGRTLTSHTAYARVLCASKLIGRVAREAMPAQSPYASAATYELLQPRPSSANRTPFVVVERSHRHYTIYHLVAS